MQAPGELGAPDLPPPATTRAVALSYARWPAARSRPPLRAFLIPGTPVVLTIVAFVIFAQAAHDSDPFAPTLDQSALYLGAASAVIVAWVCWAALLAFGLIRRRLDLAWMVILIVGLPWGALLCTALYHNAAE